jgi:lipopolysaccharide transport system ATP-binding protein
MNTFDTSRPAIRFDRVTKTFAHKSGRNLLRDRLHEMVRPPRHSRFTALHDVSFEVAHGESIGLIGENGAGKSTLLNLATGLAEPDSGTIEIEGRVAPLLELGAGFHHDLTGTENVATNAALLGLTRRELDERFEKIIEFSGVGEFMENPLRTFSAGMTVRLAFSVAIHTDPDVLLIDEVIGVGDQEFYAKCLAKIREFQEQGKTMMVATHSIELMTMLCQRALWLEHGHVKQIGPAAEVAKAYRGERVDPR